MKNEPFVHESAFVSTEAILGNDTKIWNGAQVREHAIIGDDSIIAKNAYIDVDVVIGSRCKIQNNVSIFHGVLIDDGVFVGPHVCFTNDKIPRAINIDGSLKASTDWEMSNTRVCEGASIGAGSVILPGITIGQYAMIGAGSVVTRDVAPYSLVVGNPAKSIGSVCKCGFRVAESDAKCSKCGTVIGL